MADLGRLFGADLTEAEVRYLMAEEWAETADDILWRRTQARASLHARRRAAGLTEWLRDARRPVGDGRPVRCRSRAGAA